MSATVWGDRRQGMGRSASGLIGVGVSVGLGSIGLARRRDVGPILLAIVWVERRWDVGLDIGWRHGLSGQGFGGQRHRGCLGRIIGKQRL